MKFTFCLIALLGAGFLAAEEIKLQPGVPYLASFEMTKVEISCDQNNLYLNYACEEPQMDWVKQKYKTPEAIWNTFAGEAIDITFAPYGSYHGYRFRVNPAGTFFQAFLATPKWRNRFMTAKITSNDSDWQVKTTFPFAALENDEFTKEDMTGRATYTPMAKWRINLRRSRNVTGKTQSFALVDKTNLLEAAVLVIPDEIIAPYRQLTLTRLRVAPVNDESGKSSLTARLNSSVPFTGKAKLILKADTNFSTAAEIAVECKPDEDTTLEIPFQVKKAGHRYSVNLEISNSSGQVIKLSRDLTVDNPWVEF